MNTVNYKDNISITLETLRFVIAKIRLLILTKLTFQMEWFWQEELQNNNTSCNHPSTPRQLFAYFEQKRDLPKIKRALIHETTNRYGPIEYIYISSIALPAPPGNVYGCFFRKTCPTRLHGIISSSPPHCQTRNEISKITKINCQHLKLIVRILISIIDFVLFKNLKRT